MTSTQDHHHAEYPPSPEFVAQANTDSSIYERAQADRLGFWAEQADRLHWTTPSEQVLDWSDAPVAKWFVGGKLNVAYNCVDRHVLAGNGDQVAIHLEGEPGDTRDLTYNDLLAEVSKAANTFTELGLVAGDRVAIYMPMIPEAIVTMLACARLGLTHSVVFAGFSATALRSRIDDAEAKLVVTIDGQWRRGKAAPSRPPSTKRCRGATCPVGGARAGGQAHRHRGRRGPRAATCGGTRPWTTADPTHEAQPFDAEHPLFILYTSGTTGKPKGIIHTSGGYLTQASYTHHNVFDHKPGRTCTGAPPTSAGSPATATSSTGRCRTGSPRWSTRAPRTPRRAPPLPDHREVRRQHLLHRTHPGAHLHEVGQGHPRRPRPVLDPAARLGRRADQPRGVALVPRGDRRQHAPRSSTPGGRPRPARS